MKYRCQIATPEVCKSTPNEYISVHTGNSWYFCSEHIDEVKDSIELKPAPTTKED